MTRPITDSVSPMSRNPAISPSNPSPDSVSQIGGCRAPLFLSEAVPSYGLVRPSNALFSPTLSPVRSFSGLFQSCISGGFGPGW